MRFRLVLALGAMAMAQGQWLSAYTLVRRDGRHLEVRAAPDIHDGTVYYTLLSGLNGFMAETDLNRTATERANGSALARGGRTRRPLGEPPDGGPPKVVRRVYTNDDLAKAKGLSVVEGDVTAEGKGQDVPDTHAAVKPAPPPRMPPGKQELPPTAPPVPMPTP